MELDLGDTHSISPYEEWKQQFIVNQGVITHFCKDADLPWSAFVGGWDHLGEFCAVMEQNNELREGETEREAIELLAIAIKYPLSNQLQPQGE